MDTTSLLRESRAESALDRLGFATEVGKQQYKQQLQKLTPNIGILQRRQATILALRKSLDVETDKKLESLFQDIQTIEPEFKIFFDSSDVEKDSYQQLLFSGWKPLQVFNTVPFLLLALAFFKKFIVPALAVLTPLFMVVMPYVFLKYWYNLPISTDQYIKILTGMFGLQNLDLKNPRTILQGGLTMFSIGQSIYQPIQNAIHLQTIHQQMMKKAEAAQRFVVCSEQILQCLPSAYRYKNPLQDMETQDIHRLFASFWDEPHRLRLALQCVGDCEVVYRLAKCPIAKPVVFKASDKPYMSIQDGIDPFLENPIPYSLLFNCKSHHVILTGPNRGGKSSVLRSTLLNLVMMQTFGVGFALPSGKLELRPFDWIATGLRLEDRPGNASMFESEVDFAIQILQRAKQQPEKLGFLVFDELFHSTNPPDGARTADIFLTNVWDHKNLASFISTHVFDLAKKAHSKIQKLCVPAQKQEDGDLHFTYTLQDGICEVSSVDLILREKGLLQKGAETSPPEKPKQ